MSRKVLIIGANGRFGRAALHAFRIGGWQVAAFARSEPEIQHPGVTYIRGDAFDANALTAAATGHDVIVNALNPPYEKWAAQVPTLTANVIAAGKASGATVMIPGNVYNYGSSMPVSLTEDTPHRPTNELGHLRVALEEAYAKAADDGVRTVILRGGDFIERAKTGNWFDSQITPKIAKGRITYPGPLKHVHAWAYLPDMARAMVGLAETRADFAMFETFGFPGYALTGTQLAAALERVAGRKLKVAAMPWGIIRWLQYVMPNLKGVVAMSYLWTTPHAIDGAKLQKSLPGFQPKPLEAALTDALADRLTTTHTASSQPAT